MNREDLRKYVKGLPQEEVFQELLISQVDCNTKLEELKRNVDEIKRAVNLIGGLILGSFLIGGVAALFVLK